MAIDGVLLKVTLRPLIFSLKGVSIGPFSTFQVLDKKADNHHTESHNVPCGHSESEALECKNPSKL